MTTFLVGGISRDVTGRANDPLRYTLAVNRGLRSGKLDVVELSEADILRLVADGAKALEMFHRARER